MIQGILELIQSILYREVDATMAWVQFIPMIISAASTAYGAAKQGKKNREMKSMQNKWNAENESLFNKDYYTDYMQRADAQNMIRQMRDTFDRQEKIDTNSAVVTGATVESQASGKEARNRAMSNLMGNIGAMGQRYKDQVKDRHLSRKYGLQESQYNTLGQESHSAGNLMYNGLSGIASTDWASILGSGTGKGNTAVPEPIGKPAPYATVQGSAKTTGVIPAYKNPFT